MFHNNKAEGAIVMIVFIGIFLAVIGSLIYGFVIKPGAYKLGSPEKSELNGTYTLILSARAEGNPVSTQYLLYEDQREVLTGRIEANRIETYAVAKYNKTYTLRAFNDNFYFGEDKCRYYPRAYYQDKALELRETLTDLRRQARDYEHRLSKTKNTSSRYAKLNSSLLEMRKRINSTDELRSLMKGVEQDGSGRCTAELKRMADIELSPRKLALRIDFRNEGIVKKPLLCVAWDGDILDVAITNILTRTEKPERVKHLIDKCYIFGHDLTYNSTDRFFDVQVVGDNGNVNYRLIDLGYDEFFDLTYEVDNNIPDVVETFKY